MFLFLCFPDEDKVKYVTGSGSDGTPFYKSDDFYCKTRSCTLTVRFSSCLLTLDSLLTRIHQGVKGLQAPDTRSNIGTLCDLWTLISQIHVSLWNLYLSSASWRFWGLWGQIWFILIHSYFTLGNVFVSLTVPRSQVHSQWCTSQSKSTSPGLVWVQVFTLSVWMCSNREAVLDQHSCPGFHTHFQLQPCFPD